MYGMMDIVWIKLLRYLDEKYREAGASIIKLKEQEDRAAYSRAMADLMIRQAEKRTNPVR